MAHAFLILQKTFFLSFLSYILFGSRLHDCPMFEKIRRPVLHASSRPIYTTSVLGTAPLKMGTRAQNFEHGTSVFCRVNATKIGTGAEKVEGAETFSRGSLGTSSKRCRAQILKKSKICLASRMRKIICSLPK